MTDTCARGHDAWRYRKNPRPEQGVRFCAECSNAARRKRRGGAGRPELDPALCRNQLHPKTGPGKCIPCRDAYEKRRQAQIRAQRGPRKTREWSVVEDALDHCSALYEPARALLEAARMAGCTPDAVRLHIKRRGWKF